MVKDIDTFATDTSADSDANLKNILASFPEVLLALVFGSVADGRAGYESDLDIAVAGKKSLSAEQKMAIIEALATKSGRPIDLIDLSTAGEPILGQIVRYGRRLVGSDAIFADLISRHLIEDADFTPLRNRILEERRHAWIGK